MIIFIRYCKDYKNEDDIVKAGESLKESKRKAKMPSQANSQKRDWGKGMATVGRSKVCSMPTNHFGPIPNIEVGMQLSESGVHRPPMGGIAGTEREGCQSIVISGGYEDDVDHGELFTYIGSGGRDLSGNKRTAEDCLIFPGYENSGIFEVLTSSGHLSGYFGRRKISHSSLLFV